MKYTPAELQELGKSRADNFPLLTTTNTESMVHTIQIQLLTTAKQVLSTPRLARSWILLWTWNNECCTIRIFAFREAYGGSSPFVDHSSRISLCVSSFCLNFTGSNNSGKPPFLRWSRNPYTVVDTFVDVMNLIQSIRNGRKNPTIWSDKAKLWIFCLNYQ